MRHSNTKIIKEHLAAGSLSLFGSEFYTALRAAQFFSSPFSLFFLLEHQLANFARALGGGRHNIIPRIPNSEFSLSKEEKLLIKVFIYLT
jgi:hypothetical protein